MEETDNKQGNRLALRAKAIADRAIAFWKYCSEGVWSDTRRTWQVNTIKILNLSVRSFLNTDLQTRASSLTYNTLLAIVPALALLFAIGRGFGFQNLMQSQLFNFFPAQREVLSTAFGFVDQYLAQASEGIFVGVGLVFLLWTMISLMSNIEMSFNRVWGINSDRSLGRKIIDYTAILFLLPILMICQSGVSLLMSTTILDNIHIRFITPALKVILDCTPFFLTWISYTGMYLLFPNTKVKFKNAFLCGLLAGTAFQVLQFLFLTGQLYVSKYNAIYGSFAFLPLLLIWLQLVWTITLAGAVLCYSSQNIFQFNFRNDVNTISLDYKRKIALVIMTVIVKRFENQEPPLTVAGFAELYHMPARLISALIDEMTGAGLLSVVMSTSDEHAYQPAIDPNIITLGYVLKKLNAHGSSDFIPYFKNEFEEIIELIDDRIENMVSNTSDVLLKNLNVNIKGTPK